MKLSRYNNYIKHEEKFIIYNALSKGTMLIEPLLYDLIKTANENNNIEHLLKIHPTFYKALVSDCFIIEDKKNELEEVKRIREEVDLENTRSFRLTINPTMNCNFKCWYCYESHVKDSKMESNNLLKVKQFIQTKISQSKTLEEFHISWFGGEPFLYYDQVIQPIIEHTDQICREHNVKLIMDFTTNGFLLNEKRASFLQQFPSSNYQITLDGGKEEHNTVRYVSENRGSYDDIVKNIKLLCAHQLNVILRINYTKKNLGSVANIVDDFENMSPEDKKFLSVTFHKVWQEQDNTLGNTVNSLIAYFRSKGLNAMVGGLPDNLKNPCYADKNNHAVINYNGELFKCTARDFSKENSEGFIDEQGQLIWNEKYHKRLDSKFKNKPCLVFYDIFRSR